MLWQIFKSISFINHQSSIHSLLPLVLRKRRSFIEKYYKFALDRGEKTNLIRMAAPFNIKCNFCSTVTFKGTKHNALKKKIEVKMSVDIFVFFIRCRKCNNEMMIQTDPIQGQYTEYGGCKELNGMPKSEVEHKKCIESAEETISKLGKKKKSYDEIENEILAQLKKPHD